jgi:hypothetical protein
MKRENRRARKLRDYLPVNPLFRLLVINGFIGVAISLLFLGGIFATNVGNLRGLVSQAEDPWVPVMMLAFGLVITLTSVVMGSAIMMLSGRDDRRGGGRRQRCFTPEVPITGTPAAARIPIGRS